MTLFIIFPIFSLVVFYMIFFMVFRTHQKALRLALDVGTFVVLYGIHVALIALTGQNYIGWLLIAILLIFAVNALWQRIQQVDVDYLQMIRHSWRITILIALPVQLMLFGIGIRQLFIH